jgi:mannose-6-phosphate isomerase-like protein (cupin superfamily)
MTTWTALLLATVILVPSPAVRSQTAAPATPAKPATIITAADQQTVAQAQKNPRYDAVLTVVDAGKYNVSVALTHHETPLPNASAEADITVIYIVTSGSGVLTSGGTIPDAKPNNRTGLPAGPAVSGSPKIEGGVSRKMGPGDFAIIPPNTPHSWTEVEPPLNVMAVRVDGEHVLPAGYINPALKQQ